MTRAALVEHARAWGEIIPGLLILAAICAVGMWFAKTEDSVYKVLNVAGDLYQWSNEQTKKPLSLGTGIGIAYVTYHLLNRSRRANED